jgi:integrase
MGLLVECPECRVRNSEKADRCKCGFALKKASGKNYWIEYRINGVRKRERIGLSKAAAEQRLREVLTARTEERYIDKDLAVRYTLGEICKWYVGLPEVKAKASYRRDQEFIRHIERLLGANTKIRDLTPGKVESYQRQRLAEPSPCHPGENTKPATINKEVTCLKTILNRAVRHGKLEVNPVEKVRKLPENNVRTRILSQAEFDILVEACAPHIRPIVMIAWYTGMRRSEIVYLRWGEIDLKKGFIRLRAERTKTKVDRVIPLHPALKTLIASLPRGLHTDRVFLFKGSPLDEFKTAFKTACRRAGIENFIFHDLRHCALNNLRLAGNDYFKIMAVSGHKTMSVFKRYNLVTEEELSQIRWHDQDGAQGPVDTYMDTNEKRSTCESA